MNESLMRGIGAVVSLKRRRLAVCVCDSCNECRSGTRNIACRLFVTADFTNLV